MIDHPGFHVYWIQTEVIQKSKSFVHRIVFTCPKCALYYSFDWYYSLIHLVQLFIRFFNWLVFVTNLLWCFVVVLMLCKFLIFIHILAICFQSFLILFFLQFIKRVHDTNLLFVSFFFFKSWNNRISFIITNVCSDN